MITQTRVRTRILGLSATPELTSGAFIAATGNNLVLVGDLTRRAILCTLDPKHERPETRVFDRNPVAIAKAERPKYVVAALTILRAFHVAGRPSAKPPIGYNARTDSHAGRTDSHAGSRAIVRG
jgi:putative DNA primase/helicase